MITLRDLSMHYGSQLLFDEVNLLLTNKKRYAIVGANGSGKSTLLRIICGTEAASLGEVDFPKNVVVGWMKQDQYLYENERVIDVVLRGKPELWQAMQEKEALLAEEWTDASGYKLAQIEEKIANCDGYVAESLAHTLLTGLGVHDDNHVKPMSVLSGGYKLRVLLAQCLFEEPDILLLDEPTNHLDIMSITWLEKYLINDFNGLLMFISHDINFLNNVSTKILDIDYGEINEYTGNYKQYLAQKEEKQGQKETEIKALEEKIAKMQTFVDRFKFKPSKAKQAMSRAKQIDKITLPEVKQSSRIKPKFHFESKRPSGKKVVEVRDIFKSYGDKDILQDISFDINRGEKVSIIGHNGIGKSTLLKVMLDKVTPDLGTTKWGHETHISYFAQDHHESLNRSMSIFEWLSEKHQNILAPKIRSALGQVLFTKDDIEKDVLNISGGEAARLLMANIMLQKPNVLILDEPTNHLDVESIEALEDALKAFKGTIILVSHDRHFVSKIATRVMAFTEAGIKDYQGSYREYLKYYGEDYLSKAFLSKKK